MRFPNLYKFISVCVSMCVTFHGCAAHNVQDVCVSPKVSTSLSHSVYVCVCVILSACVSVLVMDILQITWRVVGWCEGVGGVQPR